MEKRDKQVNIRFTQEEYSDVERHAVERKQKVTEFLRDLLRYGVMPEFIDRR